jgi:PAS domain S-box-containing protein
VVRPVQKLVAATRGLGKGDLGTRTEMNHKDGELGQVAKAFDEMAESLEWREAQLRESEQERLQSEGRFTEMVEHATDAIIGVDAHFRIFFFNRGARRIFGYEAEEVEGRDLRILEPGADHPRNGHSGLVAALHDPENTRVEVKVRAKDGTHFLADASFSRASRDGKSSYTLILREKKVSEVAA